MPLVRFTGQKDNVGHFHKETTGTVTVTPFQTDQAARYVRRRAQDHADAELLLAALGLDVSFAVQS